MIETDIRKKSVDQINKKINIFEAFSGVGSQSLALKRILKDVNIVGLFEWFVPAIIVYNYIHSKSVLINKKISKEKMINFLNKYDLSIDSKKPAQKQYWKRLKEKKLRFIYSHVLHSITKFNNLININDFETKKLPLNIDLFTYSFPCQDLSLQGKQKGFIKDSKSNTLWKVKNVLNYLKIKKNLPKILLLENVPNIITKKHIIGLNKWKEYLYSLGYFHKCEILKATDFGIPQNRKRFFMVSYLDNTLDFNIKPPPPTYF